MRLLFLLLSSSMSAHRTSHLTSLVLNSFLTALAPTLPLSGIYEGPGGGGVVKYGTLIHTCTFQSCTLLEAFPHLFLSFNHQHISLQVVFFGDFYLIYCYTDTSKLIYFCLCVWPLRLIFLTMCCVFLHFLDFWVTLPCSVQLLLHAPKNGGIQSKLS
jgi:hypothetical protein